MAAPLALRPYMAKQVLRVKTKTGEQNKEIVMTNSRSSMHQKETL